MKQQQLRFVCRGSLAVVGIVAARICVAMGRLIFAWYTGMDITNGAPLPTWQEEIFGDGFFYVGLLAMLGCIASAILAKKYQ